MYTKSHEDVCINGNHMVVTCGHYTLKMCNMKVTHVDTEHDGIILL